MHIVQMISVTHCSLKSASVKMDPISGMVGRILHWLGTGWWWRFSHYVVSDSCSLMGCSLLGSSVHEILQARILERVAISFSRGQGKEFPIAWIHLMWASW